MSIIEKKIAGLLQKYDVLLGFLAISIIAFQLRWHLYPHETADYSFFMKSWIAQLMEHPGLSGIGQNIGEYNVPYMLFLAIVGRTSFNDLYEIKNLSVLFDFLGSAAAVLLLSKIKGTKLLTPQNLLAYSVLLLVPNTFLNSAFWGQCDFIYVTFLLLCTYFLVKENYPAAMIFYGIALAFKLQAIFFLPVLLIYYFASRKVNILHFLWIPLVFFIMDLPAIIAGRGLSDTLNIYRAQTDIYKQLCSCPVIMSCSPSLASGRRLPSSWSPPLRSPGKASGTTSNWCCLHCGVPWFASISCPPCTNGMCSSAVFSVFSGRSCTGRTGGSL